MKISPSTLNKLHSIKDVYLAYFLISINTLIGTFKIILGIVLGSFLFINGIINILMSGAKLICIKGVHKHYYKFEKGNFFVLLLVLFGGLEYLIYMLLLNFNIFTLNRFDMNIAILIAFVSFIEFSLAIFSTFKVKEKGRAFLDLKIINLILSLQAIVLTETAILSFTSENNYQSYSSFSGILLGIFITLIGLIMFLLPLFTISGNESQDFGLIQINKNKLNEKGEIIIKSSKIYGNFVFKYKFINKFEIEGKVIKKDGFWKNSSIIIKISLIILSEILVFVWLIGRLIYFIRSLDVLYKTEKLMKDNGFIKIEETYIEKNIF